VGEQALPDLAGKPVLLVSGAADPMVPRRQSERLAALLGEAGAAVQHRTLPGGHGLSQSDVAYVASWINEL
jgi:phospholipase/carboxylesterase